MIRRAGVVAGLLGALFAGLPARAEVSIPTPLPGQKATLPGLALGGPVTLSADTLSYDENSGVVLAEGNVEVGLGPRTVRADRIRYDASSGEAEFSGHVHYRDEGDEFSFDRIVINIRTEKGALYNGSIRLSTNNYQLTSERFEKTGPRSFTVRKGSLTTCPCDPEPDWKIMVGRSRLNIDGYAVAKDVTFKVRGIPVLWLPWAAFPVKLTRQSGFLLPGFQHSGSRGYELTLPYYWAINRWSDATFTLDAMSARGYRPEAEYRYVLNDASEGAARATSFRDRLTRRERYRFYGENVLRSAGDWTANAKWDLVSDDAYYVDLVDPEILRSARAVPSRGFVARRGANSLQTLSVTWVQDHQGIPEDNTVQRLPEYGAQVLARPVGKTGIEAGGELRVENFYRRAGDRELRGRGLVGVSWPVTLYPSVSLVPYGGADLLASRTVSAWGDRPVTDSGRVVPLAGADLSAVWRRTFVRSETVRLSHTVEPTIGFRWIPDVEQSDIPTTDQWSRVRPQRQFSVALAQRLTRLAEEGHASEVGVLEVEWAYDLKREAMSDAVYVDPLQPFARTLREQIDLETGQASGGRAAASDIYARFRVAPAPRWRMTGEALFDPVAGDLTTASVGGGWTRGDEDRVLLSYGITRGLSQDVNGIVAFRPFRFLGLRSDWNYSVRNREVSDGMITVTTYPRSDCWSVGAVYYKKSHPDETSIRLMFGLRGIGEFGN
ncbi:MAG: LPS-assembly protein LptD [Gemmatimonadota bacterium]